MLLPARHCSFNPRLTSAARRTRAEVILCIKISVSIRASLQQRGERNRLNRPVLASVVSIRASLQQRGEQSENPPAPPAPSVSIRASLQQRGELIRRFV